MANFVLLISTQSLEEGSLAPFLACRLIALDKRPGVRPIGINEVICRIVTKTFLRVVGDDVEEVCGFLQKCSSAPSGFLEAAVYAMQQIYEDKSTEGILLVDAKKMR